jgi:hypothetical protein
MYLYDHKTLKSLLCDMRIAWQVRAGAGRKIVAGPAARSGGAFLVLASARVALRRSGGLRTRSCGHGSLRSRSSDRISALL